MSDKPRLLLYSDSPHATTGLGRVTRYMLQMFEDIFDIDIFAINHPNFFVSGSKTRGVWDKEKYPIQNLYTPEMFGESGYGEKSFGNFLKQAGKDYDVILTSCDWNRIFLQSELLVELSDKHDTKWVAYVPLDRYWIHEEEVAQLKLPDKTIFITKYGVDVCKAIDPQIDLTYIHHPLDPDEFPEVSPKELKKFAKKAYERIKYGKKYLVGTVNRNLFRKDKFRTIRAFAEFKKQVDAQMYMHCHIKGAEGYELNTGFMECGLNPEDVELPDIKNEAIGLPQEIVNKIYRTFDIFITSSRGEGFGYTTVEAMLTGVPIVAPNNTSFTELIGEDRGWLVDCDDLELHYAPSSVARQVVNVDKMVETMLEVYDNPDEAKKRAKNARQWVLDNLNLDYIKSRWIEELKEIA